MKNKNLELRETYRQDNPDCELHSIFKCGCDGHDVHHLMAGSGRRYDLITNLIHICREAHEYCHANPQDGRILCLWVKHQKGEIDLEEFKRCSGFYLEGWLLMVKPKAMREQHEQLCRIYLDVSTE